MQHSCRPKCGLLLLALAFASQLSLNGQSGFQANLDFQYSYMEYGRLHGLQVPLSVSYKRGRTHFGMGIGAAIGISNWNYDGAPGKIYNLDVNFEMPPWAFFGSSSFNKGERLFVLKGGTGYGVRLFVDLRIGREYQFLNRPLFVEGGAYLTRVTTSFIAAKAEDVLIYNAFGPNESGFVYPTELLFPVSVIYWDIGPFIGLRYQLTKGWRVPMGLSAAYYHGFYDNSTLSLGLYFHLPMSGVR